MNLNKLHGVGNKYFLKMSQFIHFIFSEDLQKSYLKKNWIISPTDLGVK
jgi:hypothetical protein